MSPRKSFTMTLDEDLMKEAKKRAIDLGVPFYQFVEDTVRSALVQQSSTLQKYDNGEDHPVSSSKGARR